MGAGSARIFERQDAGRLISVRTRLGARIDVGDPECAVLRGIEVRVEHADLAAELQLEAGTFANLKRWASEMRDQLRRSKSDQLARGRPCHRGRLGDFRLRRGARSEAGRKQQRKDENQATHGATMPAPAA